MAATEEPDLFENWIAHMDDALAEFLARVPPELKSALDSTPASLAHLEDFLLQRYATVDAIRSDPEPNLDAAARYVGEVFRREIGGRWRIRTDDPEYAYAGLPELTFLPERDTPVCPLILVTAALDRRTGKVLSTALESQAKRIAKARG